MREAVLRSRYARLGWLPMPQPAPMPRVLQSAAMLPSHVSQPQPLVPDAACVPPQSETASQPPPPSDTARAAPLPPTVAAQPSPPLPSAQALPTRVQPTEGSMPPPPPMPARMTSFERQSSSGAASPAFGPTLSASPRQLSPALLAALAPAGMLPPAIDIGSPAHGAAAASIFPSAASASAALSAEWERPMSTEELAQLMASPCRPPTPSHAPAPPYPSPFVLGSTSPSSSPCPDARFPPPHVIPLAPSTQPMDVTPVSVSRAGGSQQPLPSDGPQASPRCQPSPPRMNSPWRPSTDATSPGPLGAATLLEAQPAAPLGGGPVPGSGRALVEWALATSRHASPFIGVPPSPIHHACSSAVSAANAAWAVAEQSPSREAPPGLSLRTATHPSAGLPLSLSVSADDAPAAAVFSDVVRRSPRIAATSPSAGVSSPMHLHGVPLDRTWSDPRMSPCWTGAGSYNGAYGGSYAPLTSPVCPHAQAVGATNGSDSPSTRRPSSDPRDGSAPPHTVPLDRPSTDPHYSFRASTLRQSPRFHGIASPSPQHTTNRPASGRAGISSGRMPPPPPRPRPTDGLATEAKRRKPSRDPNAPMTEEDISEWLEPDVHSLDQQYGSNIQ
mmetsp:Transcript_1078/g.2861  ORF Transcript_1078/g.2861 Transcript_1078/m.2861 type:complete len:616 (+) Transcript_1078:585-2432(+)